MKARHEQRMGFADKVQRKDGQSPDGPHSTVILGLNAVVKFGHVVDCDTD